MRVRKTLIVSACIIFISQSLSAQWSTNGTSTYYNTGNVGIGTSSPRGKLDIMGGSMFITGSDFNGTLIGGALAGYGYLGCNSLTNGISISPSGNVGIGVSQATARLQLPNDGNASFRVGITGNMANSCAQILNSLAVVGYDSSGITSNGAVAWNYYNNGNNPSWSGALLRHYGTAVTGNAYGVTAANMGSVIFENVSNAVIGSNGANIFISPASNVSASFLANGNVGIGTTDTKGYKFAVNGNAIFTKVVVKAYSNWPDYVFHASYRLRPISEVEQYINQYHHLPEMPSAEEVEKNNLDLGATQAALLKKIEELTLYVIEQNKKIQELEGTVYALQQKVK